MTSVTVHTDTRELATVKVVVCTNQDGRQFLVLDVDQVTILLSFETAKDMAEKLFAVHILTPKG